MHVVVHVVKKPVWADVLRFNSSASNRSNRVIDLLNQFNFIYLY